MRNRRDFSELVKATAYARDFALCCYSGRNLWLLDGGVFGAFEVDWCDHAHPASLGGSSDSSNALTASYVVNTRRGNGLAPPLLHIGGKFTRDGLRRSARDRERVRAQVRRFADMHTSDWFLNRGFFNMLLGVYWLCDPTRANYVRDARYRARAALRFFARWRSLAGRHGVPNAQARGMLPLRLTADRRVLLHSSECTSERELLAVMRQLKPFMLQRW